MDPKVLCPTLSVMLVKTIKALCEINIKYDQRLEITGSLHVRSDGEKVLTCLLDETTIKGQQDASTAAEIAARLALPQIGFPFPALQLPANASQPQQIAAAFLSPIQQGGMPHHGLPPNPPLPSTMGGEKDRHITSPAQEPAPVGMVHQERLSKPHENHRPMSHHHAPTTAMPANVHSKVSPSVSSVDSMETEEVVQAELQQAMISLRRQSSSGGPGPVHEPQPRVSKPSLPPKLTPEHSLPSMASLSSLPAPSLPNNQQNHVKLPNIQTLTQCLPRFPTTHIKTELPSEKVSVPSSVAPPLEVSTPVSMATTPTTAPLSDEGSPVNTSSAVTPGSSNLSMPFPVDPLASVKVEVQQQLDSDGNLVHKKKFQCMFCGIFLSTKCYLKNHINAMHTRARVYPCELCERYFYSAGALRIHKLRNHWQGSKKHKCPHCGETFLLPIELRKHILKKHVGSPEAMMMEGMSPGPSAMNAAQHAANLAALGMKVEGMGSLGQTHLHPAEAAVAAASLAAAAAIAEPLSLVTSGMQVMPQNLSRSPVSPSSPLNQVSHHRHTSHQSDLMHLRSSALSSEEHSTDGIAPISPATVDSLNE